MKQIKDLNENVRVLIFNQDDIYELYVYERWYPRLNPNGWELSFDYAKETYNALEITCRSSMEVYGELNNICEWYGIEKL